jgi:hypothetical protein
MCGVDHTLGGAGADGLDVDAVSVENSLLVKFDESAEVHKGPPKRINHENLHRGSQPMKAGLCKAENLALQLGGNMEWRQQELL